MIREGLRKICEIKVEWIEPNGYNHGLMNPFKGYLTIGEFAKKAGITVQGVHKALKDKKRKIKKVTRIGYVYLIHESEMKKFTGRRWKGTHE